MQFRAAMRRAALSVAALLSIVAGAHAQDAPAQVGALKDLAAWVDKMPVGPPRLHVIGKIVAPTACHRAHATYAGVSKTSPATHRVVVVLRAPPRHCTEKRTAVPFHCIRRNYIGRQGVAQVVSGRERKNVAIQIVY